MNTDFSSLPEPRPPMAAATGPAADALAAAIRRGGRPVRATLLVELDRMHADCAADAAADVCTVPGVRHVRWLDAPGTYLPGVGARLRAMLAGFTPMALSGGQGRAPVILRHGDTVLISGRLPTADDDPATLIAQDEVSLTDLVDQAMRHVAERSGADPGFADTPRPALECPVCGAITAGVAMGPFEADALAGGMCGAPRLDGPCPGRLHTVRIVVARTGGGARP